MDHVSVEDFRAALGGYLDRAYLNRESIVVTRNGSPYVVLAPVPPKNIPTEQVKAREVREQTSKLLGQVHFQAVNFLVIRRGKPIAILTNAFGKKKR
jgi:prevent-host-death family protein